MKREMTINDCLLKRLKELRDSLEKRPKYKEKSPGDIFFENAMSGAGGLLDILGETTEAQQNEQIQHFEKYRLLMVDLSDSVHKEIHEATEKGENADPYAAYVRGVFEEIRKNQKLQIDLSTKFVTLKPNSKTNNFAKSQIFRAAARLDETVDVATEQDLSDLTKRAGFSAAPREPPQAQHAGTWPRSQTANVNGPAQGHTNDSKGSTLGERFVQIDCCDYRELYQFILYNPAILETEEHIGYIQNEANGAMRNGAEALSQRCLHHWYVPKMCRDLGANVFFQRMLGPPSPASQWFFDEMADIYEGSKKLLPKPEEDTCPEDWSPYYIPGQEPGRSHVWYFDQDGDELE